MTNGWPCGIIGYHIRIHIILLFLLYPVISHLLLLVTVQKQSVIRAIRLCKQLHTNIRLEKKSGQFWAVDGRFASRVSMVRADKNAGNLRELIYIWHWEILHPKSSVGSHVQPRSLARKTENRLLCLSWMHATGGRTCDVTYVIILN